MELKHVKLFVGRKFLLGNLSFDRAITALQEADGPWNGLYVIPGLVDIHTHGAIGEDFSDGKPQGLQPLADYYAAHGVTS